MNDQTGAVDSPQPDNVSEVSTDDLRNALGTEQVGDAELPPPEQEGLPPEAESESPLDSVQPPMTEEDKLAKRRIRPRSAEDQQVIDLYRSEGFNGTFAEASQVIYGQPSPSTVQQAGSIPQEVNPFAESDSRISSLKEEIGDLETQITEATDNLETGEALGHQRDLMRKEMEIQSIETDQRGYLERKRQEEFNTHRNKAVESRDRVLEQFPTLQNENGMERKQFDHFIRESQNNPDYAAVFESPKWPELMAREFSALVGVPQQQMALPPGQQPPAMGTQAKVLTSGAAAQPINAPLTQNGVMQNLPDMTREQLYNMLGTDDGRRVLR